MALTSSCCTRKDELALLKSRSIVFSVAPTSSTVILSYSSNQKCLA